MRTSNCSRDFLSTCGERRTVYRLIFVGRGIGPETPAPVRSAVKSEPPQTTSGANEMIFINCFSRSSRATGPKIRVPRGLFCSLIRTAAFRSNLM